MSWSVAFLWLALGQGGSLEETYACRWDRCLFRVGSRSMILVSTLDGPFCCSWWVAARRATYPQDLPASYTPRDRNPNRCCEWKLEHGSTIHSKNLGKFVSRDLRRVFWEKRIHVPFQLISIRQLCGGVHFYLDATHVESDWFWI